MVSRIIPGINVMNSTSVTKLVELTLSPSKDKYLTESPVRLYLLEILVIISTLWLSLYMSMDCTNVASMMLELMNVYNMTPITMHAIRSNRSFVVNVGMSPYPTVVTVCIMKYQALIYNYDRLWNYI